MQERSGDYARLFFLEIEIQKQLFFNRLICIIIFSLSVFLSVNISWNCAHRFILGYTLSYSGCMARFYDVHSNHDHLCFYLFT